MLMRLGCVLVTCAFLSTPTGGSPNQAPRTRGEEVATRALRPSGANEPVRESEQAKLSADADKNGFHWTKAVPWALTAGALLFAIYTYWRRRADAAVKKLAELKVDESFRQAQKDEGLQTAEEQYKSILREELGTVQVLGSHEIASVPVDLLETFVSLDMSAAFASDGAGDLEQQASHEQGPRSLTPESTLQRAFAGHRMLLVLGDAGSGKTTLLKYYAMLCLKEDGYRKLGFDEAPLPIFFPLRDVDFVDGTPRLLHDCLSRRAKRRYKDIPSKVFLDWLNNHRTLILLDGLDEISDLERRRRLCRWIDDMAGGLDKARLVVTSRWTGYRRLDQIQLGYDHVMAEVRDFSPEQQAQFLRKWFVAAYRKETPDGAVPSPQWQETQRQRGLDRAQAIIDFLELDQNRGVRELVAVPMLLQIVAILWKEHENLPQGRAELYEAALKYLVDFRERHRNLTPPLKANQALRVLGPVSLWMQEELISDEVKKEALHQQMQPIIKTMHDTLTAQAYCEYLCDRAALLVECGDDSYMFRHKSFREYLAGGELASVCKDPERLKQVARRLGDDWWEEPLRFFMGEVDDKLFDGFMDALFRSEVTKELDQKTHNLLLTLVREASQRRIDALVRCLNGKRLHDNKKRYIVDCLKTIGSVEALEAVERFSETAEAGAAVAAAQEIASQQRAVERPEVERGVPADVFGLRAKSFRNPHELNAEYIRIPGGSFEYSVTKKTEPVPDLYFAKYPVTNQRYRRFIGYLAGRVPEFSRVLPVESFSQALLALAGKEQRFREYLGDDPAPWAEKLTSAYDQEKRFKGDDQPVVAVSWYDASAYCLWLSMLEAAVQGVGIEQLGRIYRLPREVEWEWAAVGREPGGGLREYPWPSKKGKPTDKLANYGRNVGATTPVGRYPEGATPEGLMDMAGNVWECMENWYDEDKYARSLRGGSWLSYEPLLRCSARLHFDPGDRDSCIGFRVLCSQS